MYTSNIFAPYFVSVGALLTGCECECSLNINLERSSSNSAFVSPLPNVHRARNDWRELNPTSPAQNPDRSVRRRLDFDSIVVPPKLEPTLPLETSTALLRQVSATIFHTPIIPSVFPTLPIEAFMPCSTHSSTARQLRHHPHLNTFNTALEIV